MKKSVETKANVPLVGEVEAKLTKEKKAKESDWRGPAPIELEPSLPLPGKEVKPNDPEFFNEELIKRTKREEGFRSKAYRDTRRKLTIGYGRNIQEVGITEQEASYLLLNDLKRSLKECADLFPKFATFSESRRNALVDLMFNMGLPTFLEFQRMIKAVNGDDWRTAGRELIDSLYARQLRRRAERNRKLFLEA